VWWVKLCLQMQELMKSSSPKDYGVVWSLYLPSEYSIFSNHKTLQGWSKSIEEITLYLDGWIYMGTEQWGSFSFKLLTAGCQGMHFLLRSLFRQLMQFLSLSQKSNPAYQNNVEITLESFTSSQSYVYHRYLTCAFLDVTLSLLELLSPILNSHVLSVRVRKTCKNWLNADLEKRLLLVMCQEVMPAEFLEEI